MRWTVSKSPAWRHWPAAREAGDVTVDELMDLLARCEDAWDAPDRTGDPVPLLDHGLQVAAVLRDRHPGDRELQVAGLVHDLGHLLAPGDEAGHAAVGAAAVRGLLGDRVAALVELHVPAKRYLATVEPGRGLSPESARTLELQGGPMSAAEAAAFAAAPHGPAAVALRRADDLGKVVGLTRPPLVELTTWRPIIDTLAGTR
ncbi:inositol oxygenase family protein [Nonomuraea sp. NPDC047529]|uniref:inositol oxygenase family protein n=1 Tax=Nonomuraea sp. NPDC047529 TaxID=3155623 RepID=UPI0033E0D32F